VNRKLVVRPRALEELSEYSPQFLKIVEAMLQNLVHDFPVNFQVLVNQDVAKTDDTNPTLPQFFVNVAVLSQDGRNITVPVDDTQPQVGDNVISQIPLGFRWQAAKSVRRCRNAQDHQ
jgi:hypothetical protein